MKVVLFLVLVGTVTAVSGLALKTGEDVIGNMVARSQVVTPGTVNRAWACSAGGCTACEGCEGANIYMSCPGSVNNCDQNGCKTFENGMWNATSDYDIDCGVLAWRLKQTYGPLNLGAEFLTGVDVAISADGTRIALPKNTGKITADDTRVVRVFEKVGTDWIEIAGIESDQGFIDCGYLTVDLSSDGMRLAVRGIYATDAVEGGIAYVFQFESGSWKPLGSNLDGDSHESWRENWSNSIDLTLDGSRVVIGSLMSYGGPGSLQPDHPVVEIRTYDWTGSEWKALSPIDYADDSDGDHGTTVQMSGDGSRMVATFYGQKPGAVVAVFDFDTLSEAWLSTANITLPAKILDHSSCVGEAGDMSTDGTRIVVSNSCDKKLYIYDLVEGAWSLTKTFSAADDAVFYGKFFDLSADGTTISIGTVDGGYRGTVEIFKEIDDTWTLIGDVEQPEEEPDIFSPVMMNGDGSIMVVGAIQLGSAFVFEHSKEISE